MGTSTLFVRLLSSVAVVGRDNEPIYLRGDLCNTTHIEIYDDEIDADDNEDVSVLDADASPLPKREKESNVSIDEKKDEDGDPFGFFTEKSHSMSLTQQLVLHASLDRFEEMARSNTGTVRWRTPGSNGANAMWMGLLCEVEERWNVYGYLTNTGIKFMIIVENVQLNEDGVRIDYTPSFASQPPHREADLKSMFSHLHELYVRYTMNPFSKLRSPIQSKIFDDGIYEMAKRFNGGAVKRASKVEEGMSWM